VQSWARTLPCCPLLKSVPRASAAAGEKKQLAYILGRHGLVLDLSEGPAAVADDSLREELQQIIRCVTVRCFSLFCCPILCFKWPATVENSVMCDGRQQVTFRGELPFFLSAVPEGLTAG
jgi:hypothetical protein